MNNHILIILFTLSFTLSISCSKNIDPEILNAMEKRDITFIKKYLNENKKIKGVNEDGSSALMIAIEMKQYTIAGLIIESESEKDLNIKNKYGISSYLVAMEAFSTQRNRQETKFKKIRITDSDDYGYNGIFYAM